MDYEIFSSNKSILQSSAIHPKIATADLISRFEGEGITSAFNFNNIAFIKIRMFCLLFAKPG